MYIKREIFIATYFAQHCFVSSFIACNVTYYKYLVLRKNKFLVCPEADIILFKDIPEEFRFIYCDHEK